jgi:hypothetical protein
MQLTARQLSQKYGYTDRHWIRMAAAGKIPGARQPFGHGGTWFFDEDTFLVWWNAKDRGVRAWEDSTGGTDGGTLEHGEVVSNTENDSVRRIEASLREHLGIGSIRSTGNRRGRPPVSLSPKQRYGS